MATAKEEKRRNSLIIPKGEVPKREEQPVSTTETMQLLTTETIATMQNAVVKE